LRNPNCLAAISQPSSTSWALRACTHSTTEVDQRPLS
jgi:hypothetical protein